MWHGARMLEGRPGSVHLGGGGVRNSKGSHIATTRAQCRFGHPAPNGAIFD